MKKLLFTPGPLTTSGTVKEAMLEDMGSRDYAFVEAVKEIRSSLLELAGVSKDQGYECVLMQGSGTFGVESVISSVIGVKDKLLILSNGAYGERIINMAAIHRLSYVAVRWEENEIITAGDAGRALQENPGVTHVVCIHSETTTGLFNPVGEIGAVCKKLRAVFIVDAMSSFGGVEMDMRQMGIDFLISSSNKCIEGVPGFAFAICKRAELEKAAGQARSLSLDLAAQWAELESSGQFRFTPPTLSIMAFLQALKELDQEGGIKAREKRYQDNKKRLDEGMNAFGFKQYLEPWKQGHIITSFLYPQQKNFVFDRFYKKLNERGLVIYPGKLSRANAFRIGNIGHLFPEDVQRLLDGIGEILVEEDIDLK